MSQDKTFPEPDKAVQTELAELVQRAMAEKKETKDGKAGSDVIERLQKMTERLPKWTPLPESPEGEE